MTHVLSIARREIEERAFVFVAAIAIALVSLIVLVIPHGSFGERKSGVVFLGFFLGVSFTWALALILGATLVGRELSEKRLSFYFTRPLSGSAVWFGKLLAALVLLAVSFAIVHAIPLGLGFDEFRTMSTITRGTAVAGVLAVAILLMTFAHVLSTWIRSRSAILGLDFVALLIVLGIFLASALPLVVSEALFPFSNVVALFVVALLIVGIGGGAWQLNRGRIDARRNHRELSIFVWVVVGIAAVSALVYSRWVLGATPRDGRARWVIGRGGMLEITDEARGYWPSFIVNPATGAYVHGSRPVATAGTAVATVVATPTLFNAQRAFQRRFPLVDQAVEVSRLEREPRTIASIPVTGYVTALGVNEDGSRVAIVTDDILTVYDTRSGKDVASSKLKVWRNAQLRFVSPFVLRAFTPLGEELRVRDFDLRTRTWSNVVFGVSIRSEMQYQIAGQLVLTRNNSSAEVRDLRDPGAFHVIPLSKDNGVWLMKDGRLAIFHRAQPAYIEIQRNGVQQRLIRFSRDAEAVRVGGEIGNGQLLASSWVHESQSFDMTTYIIDASTGAITRTMPHTYVVGPGGLGAHDPEAKYSALFHRDSGKIDVIDLQTGAIRPLF
ncbi:MAG TPA: hypothetical protein VF381_09135 [Thermoanaerobaculia bacterium]